MAATKETPDQVEQVSTAWRANAIKAGEAAVKEWRETGSGAEWTRRFWAERLYVYVEDSDNGARWVVGDNYERCRYMIYYPDTDAWFYMRPYGSEMPMVGGISEAIANAEITWTG
jgi:hypothetical protein